MIYENQSQGTVDYYYGSIPGNSQTIHVTTLQPVTGELAGCRENILLDGIFAARDNQSGFSILSATLGKWRLGSDWLPLGGPSRVSFVQAFMKMFLCVLYRIRVVPLWKPKGSGSPKTVAQFWLGAGSLNRMLAPSIPLGTLHQIPQFSPIVLHIYIAR